jgi:hypothetical protein
VALIVDRRAAGRQVRGVISLRTVLAGTVHARPARSGPRTVSALALLRHRPGGCLPSEALRGAIDARNSEPHLDAPRRRRRRAPRAVGSEELPTPTQSWRAACR